MRDTRAGSRRRRTARSDVEPIRDGRDGRDGGRRPSRRAPADTGPRANDPPHCALAAMDSASCLG
ncbi:hypothetical protein C7S16_4976 [Burkholderia thailandensis]|uniref:Uncharacterized protein n=1 Tax=Burkholderia thailandensis TaxID=57975 RepID=A0AAW9CK52_BURTH|nr:hypothetical protein [Burkholderia thailandensis]MDW9250597.1 hypothetical protein [Burkholderia thailandensis]